MPVTVSTHARYTVAHLCIPAVLPGAWFFNRKKQSLKWDERMSKQDQKPRSNSICRQDAGSTLEGTAAEKWLQHLLNCPEFSGCECTRIYAEWLRQEDDPVETVGAGGDRLGERHQVGGGRGGGAEVDPVGGEQSRVRLNLILLAGKGAPGEAHLAV